MTTPYYKNLSLTFLKDNPSFTFPDPSDILSYYEYLKSASLDCHLFEANIAHLISIKAGTMCGSVGNTAWTKLTDFSDLMVRGLLDHENNTSSVLIQIPTKPVTTARKISRLIDLGDGSLRCEEDPIVDNWYFFETE